MAFIMDAKLSKFTIFSTLMLCPLLIGIDFLGIGVTLPSIAKGFGVSLDTVHWLVTIFAIGYVGFVITATRLADVYGRKPLFILSVALFGLSSLLVGCGTSFWMILLGRFIQGLSGGSMMMIVIAMIAQLFTGNDRKNWISVLISIAGLGMALGPIFGGFLVQTISWRALFLINVPIALLVVIFGTIRLPNDKEDRKKVGFDIPGMVLICITLSSFALVISEGPFWGFLSAKAIVLHCIWVVSLIAFCIVEAKQKNPLVKGSLFLLPNFTISTIVIGALLYFSLSAWVICSSLYFHLAYHFDALQIGLTFLPFGVVLFLMNFVMPHLNKYFSSKTLVNFGGLLCSAAFACLAIMMIYGVNLYLLSIGTILYGIAFVLINSLSLQLALAYFEPADLNIGSGMNQMFRWTGAAIGAPVMSSIFSHQDRLFGHAAALSVSYIVLAVAFGFTFIAGIFFIKQKKS